MNVCVVFPGQGSQYVGMMKDLLEDYKDIINKRFSVASDLLGIDLLDIALNGPEELINQTKYTQPILLSSSIALWDIISGTLFDKVHFMAGHSLGEYSALVAAEVIDFESAVQLVHYRGTLMQEAVKEGDGSMAAILGMKEEDIVAICKEVGGVSLANYNTPAQSVISGKKQSVEEASALCKEKGAKKIIPLTVSVPSHCDLMASAAQKLSGEIYSLDFNLPKYSVYQNVNASCTNDISLIKENLVKQLYSPVFWYQSIISISEKEPEISFVECGSGKVLSGLTKKINPSAKIYTTGNVEQIKQIEEIFS